MSARMTRRTLIGGSLSVAAAMSMPLAAQAHGHAGKDEATTRYGRVRGRREDGIVKFLGVPYATPPLGELRFKAPRPPQSWSGVRDTVDFPHPAFQVAGGEMGPTGNGRMPAPSEDCLYLNIWTPAADRKRRPVMFYHHGGGYMIGSGSATGQDGTHLAQRYDVVVVESNHRLGLLGYLFLGDLAHGDYAANQGMLDILAALRWTAENIEHFGGDPDNIMVWGESGGGAKTAAVYTMPAAAPLFHKASIESAAPLRFPARDGATARAERTLQLLGLTKADIPKLTDIPAARLLFAITTSPIWRDAIKIAKAKAAQHRAPVFMYQLAYPNPTRVPGTDFPLGSPHASDINLKFATTEKNPELPGQYATARHMSALWAGFARDSRPKAPHVPTWPAYTPKDRATMWIDAHCKVVNDPDRAERLYWERRPRSSRGVRQGFGRS
jgi:carboxylesterase type B